GQAGMLDTARFTNFVAGRLSVRVASVSTLTLGSHGDTMVPVPSACTVDGKPLTGVMSEAEIGELVERTRQGGAEIVALLKTGSAYYAPSAAAARMARAVAEDAGVSLPVCAWVDGQYGISGVYLGVEAEVGASGVRRIVERDLTERELAELRAAAEAAPAKQADGRTRWPARRPSGGRRLPDRLPQVEGPVASFGDLWVVRRQHEGSALGYRVENVGQHEGPRGWVEFRGGLVGDDQPGLDRERTGHCDALLLS